MYKQDLYSFIAHSVTMYLDIKNPVWGTNGVGYTFDPKSNCIFLRVPPKYQVNKDIHNFQVRIGAKDVHAILTGELLPQTTEETQLVFHRLVKEKNWDQKGAQYALYDQRSNKPRKNSYKLKLKNAVYTNPVKFEGIFEYTF